METQKDEIEYVASSETMIRLEENIYNAGLIDGEGNLGIYKNNRTYVGEVKISMSDRLPLLDIATRYNRTVSSWQSKTKCKNGNSRKKMYQVVFRGDSIIDFLSDIIPYLKVKKDQAEILLDYQIGKSKIDNHVWSVDEIFEAGELSQLLKVLKMIPVNGKEE